MPKIGISRMASSQASALPTGRRSRSTEAQSHKASRSVRMDWAWCARSQEGGVIGARLVNLIYVLDYPPAIGRRLAAKMRPRATLWMMFLSGAAALGYEVVWMRMLTRAFGVTVYAV